jgi:hypothetical protein
VSGKKNKKLKSDPPPAEKPETSSTDHLDIDW